MTTDLNLNSVECLQSIRNIGGTIMRNVCTGVDSYVPWGVIDWVKGMTTLGLIVLLGIVILAIVAIVMRDGL